MTCFRWLICIFYRELLCYHVLYHWCLGGTFLLLNHRNPPSKIYLIPNLRHPSIRWPTEMIDSVKLKYTSTSTYHQTMCGPQGQVKRISAMPTKSIMGGSSRRQFSPWHHSYFLRRIVHYTLLHYYTFTSTHLFPFLSPQESSSFLSKPI